ncbi:POT family MFS transporter [Vitiosangium sp. GDMCC 1.1324]|uniref:POT family MFS transporter n=1 Tax=Vitiosangium sp. (strain GDMCC 1.1324) TaxID=2138576 RepID=UPI000D3C66DC|nr:POT family MFS transporter [Vitiosangium sp. GDMCC 1.1324]PTL77480.1 MFS transporter [Vitiosangium sp. GDMCC 1.1324]
MAGTSTPSTTSSDRFPPQIPFIIGNEACERFSFYGMRNILTVFLIDYLLRNAVPDEGARSAQAKSLMHLFMAGVYFTPLLGGWLADRWFGKYKVILSLSLVYCLGHACLALFENNATGFYTGLVLISLGSGGIKPCVAAMVGDQFNASNKHLVKKVFAIFYWTINLGSFFASLTIPLTLKHLGPSVAFGIPGILMFIATAIFWAGRRHYVVVPPTGPNPHSFLKVVFSALRHRGASAHWLDGATKEHPAEAVEGARAVLRIGALLLPTIPFFWMLFDQKASTWVIQARSMDPQVGPITFEPSQMQFINPALVMILIPVLVGVVYPAFQRAGWELTPLRRMPLGLAVGAFSYAIAGYYQVLLEQGSTLNIAWQLLPYIVLTLSEILVSTTGLEFAYTQAPREMKGIIQSVWLLTTTLANVAVAIAAALNVFSGSGQFFFYGALALVAAVGMALMASRYQVRDYYQPDVVAGPVPDRAQPPPATVGEQKAL